MELYLDSVDFKEIEAALDFGFIKGLTTTPTFMHRHGITDIDGAIVKLSRMVPELQVEALGNNPDEILAEAERLLGLGLAKPPVFKVPISNDGVKACKRLTDKGHRVNVHLIYTLNQAYMAMEAGAAVHLPAGRAHAGPGARRDPAVRAVRRRDRPLRLQQQGHVLLGASCRARASGHVDRRARVHDAVQRHEEPL